MKVELTKDDVFNYDLNSNAVVHIPSCITKIGRNAFAGSDEITTVVLPDSVEVIGKGAFRDCYSLTAVVVTGESRLRKIGKKAFANTELVSMTIPADTAVAQNALKGCHNFRGFYKFDTDSDYESSEDENSEMKSTSEKSEKESDLS